MAHIVELRLRGYRAISAPLVLTGLGSYVAIFGDNAVGKSSVLRAVALLGRLCATPAMELIGSGRPWPIEAFFERFSEDTWMFNAGDDSVIEIGAKTDAGLAVTFKISLVPEGIEVAYTAVVAEGEDLLVALSSARRDVAEAEKRGEDESDYVQDMLYEARSRLGAVYERVVHALSPLHVSVGPPPVVPVPEAIRSALFDALGAPDATLRTRLRSVLKQFQALFPALGEGEIDVLVNRPLHEKDLAWVSPTLAVPLDQLGGGVQSVVATLASLMLGRTPLVCLDEPEAFVGARALEGLAAIFRSASQRRICEQVFIAAHSVSLVGAEDPIVVLDRKGGTVSARQGKAAQLGGRFAQLVQGKLADQLGRLGQDGSVRLPPSVIERTGLRPGDFVYFVDDADGVRVLTGEQMDATLPEPHEP